MEQLSFINHIVNRGFQEIVEQYSPIIFKDKDIRKNTVYYKNKSKYAICTVEGYFIVWDLSESNKLLKNERILHRLQDNR